MSMDPNSEWDYVKLTKTIEAIKNWQQGLNEIIAFVPDPRSFLEKRDAYQHCIDFIEYNMREMNIVSPTETYLTMK